jgi:N-acetylglutamate synthase/N-acetylornithine aminotransferase
MEWVSPEVEQFYTILNKVYTTLLIHNHPYVKKMLIDPISFNQVFIDTEEKYNDVIVIMCAEFTSLEYRNKDNDRELGTDVSQLLIDIIKMIPNNEILNGRKLYAKLDINEKRDCEGVVKYHRD